MSASRPWALLSACPAYEVSPLIDAPKLAQDLGVSGLWLKDETSRMRLGSFKALGGAFAVVQMILDRAGGVDPMTPATRAIAQQMTFITASAGNHGLSIAAGAQVFSAHAKIVLSTGVPEGFANRIRKTGAEVIRIAGSYEDSVAEAARLAAQNDWIHLADGSWEGYTAPPALVMEGYTVLAEECRLAFAAAGRWPSHVVLQAGVGGLAAATAAHIRAFWPEQPTIIVVEPDAAPCLMESIRAGQLVHTPGPVSNMGRLDCKDASLLAFDALRHDADTFVTISDAQAVAAASDLSATGMATTPSGAAGLAALRTLDLGPAASCLIIVSEGPEGD
ncbi:diaminopropionate ammonia-lyase [Aquicoccus sp. G2-2]|uniref:diaminopropionate ammonia-lyase n=1 Tax=Aquicoccus sp. G2-2 TaxID=3092120 RepID=UPI002ADFED27|nr:diaminopropionate ammonia-lyase [Aquicoccus sp. G2-2]MEA1112313.1 diaminopropionate ammonia-lyase [Aquicoccus sp. G2-2]